MTARSHLAKRAPFGPPSVSGEAAASITPLQPENCDLYELWQQILGRLPLPSTRMLLSRQTSLTKFELDRMIVSVNSNCMAMAQSRLPLLANAVVDTLGSRRAVILIVENSNNVAGATDQINGLSQAVGSWLGLAASGGCVLVPPPEPLL
jgi:hypothetical protein